MASAGNYDADDSAGQLDDERTQFGLLGGLGWRTNGEVDLRGFNIIV
jgi:hypothetical protein